MPVSKTPALALLLLFGLTTAGFSAEPGRKILRGHVPAAVAHLTALGRLPATNNLTLAIGLPLRNQDELAELLRQIYDPRSTNYHKYLTPEEFTARFGPTEQDYAAVKNFARTNGLAVTGTFANRLLLDVTGRVPAVETAFHITLRTYRHPTENRNFFATDAEPTVDANLPVVDVSGLDNFSRPHPKLQPFPATVTPRVGSAPSGGYMGDDFRAAYVPGTTLDGSGQTVGLLQFDGFYASDIAAYESLAGRTNIPVQAVLLDGVSGIPGFSNIANGNTEVSLDIEMSISLAPALAQVLVFEGNSQNDILNTMAASNTVKNLSSSWGWGGGPSTSTDNIFKTMAAQGQSFFNATGDSDAFPAGGADASVPSSSPYITQVGGTTLSTAGAGGDYVSETVWNRGGGIGSSGGVSTYYAIPAWQQGVNSFANNGGSITTRNVPDVALTGESVYVQYGNGSAGNVGGTSCAAPLWAGFMALVNQQAAASGQPSVGFINPAIYELANESIYDSVFHDTIVGNNTSSSSPNAFYAVPGYDLCTGVGTPNGTNLINALVNPDPLVVAANGGFNAVGTSAGTFNPAAQTFYLTNAGTSPLDWSLVNTSAWLDVSADSGTLDAGAGSAVMVSLNTVASNLPAGLYPASLGFANDTSGVTHFRLFTLQTSDPLVIIPTNNFSFVGPSGGPFAPATQEIILTNARSDTLGWSLNNASPWFDVSPASGSLAAGTASNVAFTLTPTVTNLPDGIYSAVFQVTNLSSQFVQVVTGSILIGQPLVQNGGFETGDFTGWTLNGDGYNANYVDGSGTFVTAHSGTYCALLGEPGVLAYLSQTITTTAGQKYLISLWLNNPLTGSSRNPNEFSVAWNGSTLYDKKNLAQSGWTQLQFVVTVTGSGTALQIGGLDNNYYLGLDDVAVTPGFAPAMTMQPANLTVISGSNAIFSAMVTGTTNLVYQWRNNGVNLAGGAGISGATSNVLTLAAVTSGSAGNYTLFVTNFFGVVTSSVASLTVLSPPAITSSSLTNRIIQCGSNSVAFAVTVSGTPPLTYQWSLDGLPAASATNTSFSLTNLSLPNHTVTIVVTNLYGSLASNALLTVQDILPPAITLNGSNPFFIELGGVFADPGATATDVCAGDISVLVSGSVNTNAVGTNTLTYTAADGNGNNSAVTRTVIVRDTTPPTILWSFTNLVLAADTNCSAKMPDVTATNFILATDLSGALTISQSPTNNAILFLGTNILIITVMDASGNTTYSTNQIIIQDQTPPVVTLNGGSPFFSELGQVFADSGATADDACAGVVAVSVIGSVNTNATGTNILTYTAADGSGNTSAVTRTVVVRDTTPPTILWSFTNLVLAADSHCSAKMPDVTGTNFIFATDLSGALTIWQSPTNNAILFLGTNILILTVMDASGNTTYSTNQIIIQDQTPPVITLNGASSMFSELGQAFADLGATADDACAGAVPVVASGAVNPNVIGTNILTYTAADGNGNTSAVTRTVVVRDTTPPTILWSFTNLVLAADSHCSAMMPAVTGTNFILATDLSGVAATLQRPPIGSVLVEGTNTVVLTVLDGYDNVAYSTNQIIVQDQTPPVITLNGASSMFSELGHAFADRGATADDACAGVVAVVVSGAVNPNVIGTNILTYTATDSSGNSNSVTRTVVVRDTTPPTILWSFTNLVLAADTNCSATMPDVTGASFIFVTDLSGVAAISQSPTNGAVVAEGTNTVVLTVLDAYDNATYSTNQIIVQDQTPPIITLNGASSMFSELGQAFADPGATADDACAGVVAVSVIGSVNTNAVGTNILTYTAADGNGNTSAVTRAVVVRDTTPPTILWSFTNLVLAADSNCSAMMPDVTGTNFILVMDLSEPMAISQIPTNGSVLLLKTNLVVVVVSDFYGNTAFSTNTIVVQDQTPPVVTLNGGSPIFSELGQAFADPGATADDACAEVVAVSVIGSVNTNATGTNILTYTAADGSGNTSAVTRTVVVRDTTPPTILWSFTNLVLAADSHCSAKMPDVTGTNFIFATDLSGALTIWQSPTNNAILFLGTNILILTVMDASGNTTYSTNQIIIQDQTPPLIGSQPQNQTNNVGDTANFSVAATACTPLAFQWFFGNAALAAQTNGTLTLSNLTSAAAGNYSVVVSASGGSTTSAVATLTVNLLASTVALASSENPSGYNDTLNFTATLTPAGATGPIQFFTNGTAFDLETPVAGQAVSTNLSSLPRGTNVVIAVYSGDANDLPATNLVLQIVTNHPPVAAPAFYTNVLDAPLIMAIASLATNWRDVDGDTVSLVAAGVSADGFTVTNNGTALVYFNPDNVADQFICTITDGWGGTNFQTVFIAPAPLPNAPPFIVSVVASGNGVILSLGGAAGFTYVLETTANLFPSENWRPVATNTLGPGGVWQFNDTQATNFSQRFYRLKLAP